MSNNKFKISRKDIESLERSINYRFENMDLIIEALSHPSLKQYQNSKEQTNYERFEILGDAILGFVITEILFNLYRESEEKVIAKLKSHLVSKETICQVAKKINLANFIIMTKGEEDTGGRSNSNNIENAMEALITAIYLDSDMENTKEIITELWADLLQVIDFNQLDPKTSIQEWSQSRGYGTPQYLLLEKVGVDHMPNFTVELSIGDYKEIGHGNSIKNAEKNAAKKLLSIIEY